MTFTIGRASLAKDPSAITWSGDQVTISGWLAPTSAGDLNSVDAQRQQLLGLVNNFDEDVFPITFSGFRSTWDGFYTVQSVNVSAEPGVGDMSGFLPYTIQATRLTNYSRPAFETIVSTAVRTNGHSVTAPAGISYAYFKPTAYTWSDTDIASITTTSTPTVTSEDGTIQYGVSTAPVATTSWRLGMRVADFYLGTTKLEIKYGSTWYPVHGLQIPAGIGGNWRISNGYCRVYPSKTNGTYQGFTVETYRSGWVGREFCAYLSAGPARSNLTGDGTNYADPAVLQNAPESVTVAIPLPQAVGAGLSAAMTAYRITFTLQAGNTWVEVGMLPTTQVGIGCSTNVASTAFTGGIAATASDGNGLRYLISTGTVSASDTTYGALTSSSTLPVFAVTADYLAGVATTTTGVRDLFYAARSDKRRVVVR